MAENVICLNCGKELKEQWLVCKFCNQAHWKMIRPFFIGGVIMVVFAVWAATQKIVFTNPAFGDLITAFLPLLGWVFGIIGGVCLLIGVIAAIRGLFVKKVK